MNATARKKAAAAAALAEQIAALPENVMMCRDMRHAWMVEVPWYKVKLEGGTPRALYIERTVACMRCDTKRVETAKVHTTFVERLSARYVYPENYRVRGAKREDNVLGRVRLEMFHRSQGTS